MTKHGGQRAGISSFPTRPLALLEHEVLSMNPAEQNQPASEHGAAQRPNSEALARQRHTLAGVLTDVFLWLLLILAIALLVR